MSSDCTRLSPGTAFFSHALEDEDVGIDRHAHRQHDAGDARQASALRRASTATPMISTTLASSAILAMTPSEAVGNDRERHDEDRRRRSRRACRPRSKSAPRPGPTVRSSMIVELGRQRAGAQQHGKVVGAFDGEVAGDLARSAEDRFADYGRRNHLLVEDDGEQPADIGAGRPGRSGSRPCCRSGRR